MNPNQALQILAQATEPGAKLTRIDFVNVQLALEVLDKLVNPNRETKKPEVKEESV
jgi:hypothetical protein